MQIRAMLDLVDKPQGTHRCHDQAKRIGAYDPLPLATLILAWAIKGSWKLGQVV